MKYLVTGAAGFIGMHTCIKLLKNNIKVVGIDNLNNYYDVKLKFSRLKILKKYRNFKFYKVDIADPILLKKIFQKILPSHVIHLAAQAGVRYSIKKPNVYAKSNLYGFTNILEMCRNFKIKHLVFASSSSVYGGNIKFPFSETDNVDHPVSFYAATKKINEILAHSFSLNYNLNLIGLRFFTVYGPYGRPDMSYFKFTDSILKNKVIEIYNNGKNFRDFTYIDDVVDSIDKLIKKRKYISKNKIINIGSSKPINDLKFISIIEKLLNRKAKKKYLLAQKGDVLKTFSDTTYIKKMIRKKHFISIEKGLINFIEWYKKFYGYK